MYNSKQRDAIHRFKRLTLSELDAIKSECNAIYDAKITNAQLADTPCTAPECASENKKEQNMHAEIALNSGFNSEREYLLGRLNGEKYRFRDALRKTFKMDENSYPQTIGELKEYLDKGYLKFNEKAAEDYSDKKYLYDWCDYIKWENPEKVSDEDGYKAAFKKLEAAYQEAKDIISVKSIDEGFAALKDFQSKTFH